ncbi:DUF4834 family protein [Pontibacter arcticus]|uniref:DUF4834 domain-containing protein n=1 Tax=Pontibacter arcticus TaxID=2080288 RepID=A0A364RB40_9BACT|nr:DUF4834 family protein [Pontibacter arcticus]RAU81548.1 DUF4834 domain-containing protein [Pontibacter arcticus]
MLKFIIITALIFFFMRLVAPVLLRYLLATFIKKKMGNGAFFNGNMHQQGPRTNGQPFNNTYGGPKAPNSDIKIDYIPEKPGRKGFDGGKYVDYEEVK